MIESNEVFAESRQLLLEPCRKTSAEFLNVELELSTTFAQTALNSFAAGKVEKARRIAAARREALATVRKFLPKLTTHERQIVDAKLATDPL
jgi:hypothetical protein